MDETVEPKVSALSRDLAKSAATLGADEARFLVDAYYTMQEGRIRTGNQIRALSESGEPHSVINWLNMQDDIMEKQIKRALEKYAEANPLGKWAMSICGIGPVIAAGLLAHIQIGVPPDPNKPGDKGKGMTAGSIWRYAGYDPTSVWEKGQKRPWNATLKTLCWKIGESFVKVQNREDDVYGQIYAQRKAEEIKKNDAGLFAEQAAAKLAKFKIGKNTDAYKWYSSGKLPPAHIHARAKRYAVKLFLAHYHEMGFRLLLHKEPPVPYPIAILGHAHRIPAPNDTSGLAAE